MRLESMDRASIERDRRALHQVYVEAFGATTQEGERFLSGALDRHVRYAEFRGLTAVVDDAVVGFTYGYRTQPGTWWNETIRPAMVKAGVEDWLDDAFEFVELSVLPAHQGAGIGGALHDTLMSDAPGTRALLTTAARDTRAMGMYLKRGWQVLVGDFRYPHVNEDAVIMGLDYRNRDVQTRG